MLRKWEDQLDKDCCVVCEKSPVKPQTPTPKPPSTPIPAGSKTLSVSGVLGRFGVGLSLLLYSSGTGGCRETERGYRCSDMVDPENFQ